MQVEKLKLLDKFHHEEKNAKVKLVDGSSILCIPWDWSYEEDFVAYTVKLLEPPGTFYTIKNEDIASIEHAY